MDMEICITSKKKKSSLIVLIVTNSLASNTVFVFRVILDLKEPRDHVAPLVGPEQVEIKGQGDHQDLLEDL